jgi:hypothetical protein
MNGKLMSVRNIILAFAWRMMPLKGRKSVMTHIADMEIQVAQDGMDSDIFYRPYYVIDI